MSKDVPGRGISLPVFELGTPGSFFHVYLNPRVTFASVAIIWSFIAFTLSERWQAYKEFQMWMTWVRGPRPAPGDRSRPPPRAPRWRAGAGARAREVLSFNGGILSDRSARAP